MKWLVFDISSDGFSLGIVNPETYFRLAWTLRNLSEETRALTLESGDAVDSVGIEPQPRVL
jgi:hypothetical protein